MFFHCFSLEFLSSSTFSKLNFFYSFSFQLIHLFFLMFKKRQNFLIQSEGELSSDLGFIFTYGQSKPLVNLVNGEFI